MLALKHGLSFEDLYGRPGLVKLDGAFLAFLGGTDATLAAQLEAARATPDALSKKEESDLLIALAPYVEDFVADLFGIERGCGDLIKQRLERVIVVLINQQHIHGVTFERTRGA